MEERKSQIVEAYDTTYHWILQLRLSHGKQWDDFLSFLGSATPENRIYWIRGKPGAGKSSLMRYIGDHIDATAYACPWAAQDGLIQAQFFFWSPGSTLQKSLIGLLGYFLGTL
jgi:hypothetical protein